VNGSRWKHKEAYLNDLQFVRVPSGLGHGRGCETVRNTGLNGIYSLYDSSAMSTCHGKLWLRRYARG